MEQEAECLVGSGMVQQPSSMLKYLGDHTVCNSGDRNAVRILKVQTIGNNCSEASLSNETEIVEKMNI